MTRHTDPRNFDPRDIERMSRKTADAFLARVEAAAATQIDDELFKKVVSGTPRARARSIAKLRARGYDVGILNGAPVVTTTHVDETKWGVAEDWLGDRQRVYILGAMRLKIGALADVEATFTRHCLARVVERAGNPITMNAADLEDMLAPFARRIVLGLLKRIDDMELLRVLNRHGVVIPAFGGALIGGFGPTCIRSETHALLFLTFLSPDMVARREPLAAWIAATARVSPIDAHTLLRVPPVANLHTIGIARA